MSETKTADQVLQEVYYKSHGVLIDAHIMPKKFPAAYIETATEAMESYVSPLRESITQLEKKEKQMSKYVRFFELAMCNGDTPERIAKDLGL